MNKIYYLFAVLFSSLLFLSPPAFADPSSQTFQIFKSIEARTDTSVDKWTAQGVSKDLAGFLVSYETNPSMKTAIAVLQHYNTFADKKMDDVRREIFKNDPQLFQTLDAAKYELILKTQQRLNGIDHAMRVGSTGKRYRAWLDWVGRGRPMDDMPKLDANKQFKSDDDVTNVASEAAVKANALAGELINGETARDEFKAMTKQLFGLELDPKAMQVEFLSPTSAFKILHARRPGDYPITGPTFLQAWFSSDPEKYNGMFGVEQLHDWGMGAGVVTSDVNHPENSTESFKDFKTKNPDRAIKGFPASDLFGWMANNHRQIFLVHKGDLKSLAKYTMRMIEGWQKVQAQLGKEPPADWKGLDLSDIYETAEMIYKPETEAQINHVRAIQGTAYTALMDVNRKLLVGAHKENMKALVVKLADKVPPHPTGGSVWSIDDVGAYLKQAQGDPEIEELMNNIAIGYTNIDKVLIRELMTDVETDIQKSTDQFAQGGSWDSGFKAKFMNHVSGMFSDMESAADATRADIEAFRFIRYNLGEHVNAHLTKIAGMNLDHYLVQMAVGDITEKQIRFMGGTPQTVERILTPEEIGEDLKFIEAMSKEFNWGDAKLAQKVREYFEGDPPTALKVLKHLHTVFDPSKMKAISFKYKDESGNEVVKTIQPTRWESVRSLGILAFKGALKGWKIWGDAANGRDLYQNMAKIYGDDSLSAEQVAAAQAKALSSFISVVEYAELVNLYGASTLSMNIPLGSTFEKAASLSDGGYLDPQQQKDFTLTVIKDLTIMAVPQLAIANAIWGMASFGYDKWALSSSKAGIIDLLVENGDWKIPTVKAKDDDGNEIEVVDRTKLPELLGVKFTAGGEKIIETVPVLKFTKKGQTEESTSVPRLAKIPQSDQFKDGVMLLKSKTLVKPRESLLDVAYRDGQGYIANHAVLEVIERAVRDLIDDKWFQFKLYWTNTKDWTKEWLGKEMGVRPPTPEDSRVLIRKPVIVERTAVGATGMRYKYDWDGWIKDGIRKNFGYLVSDYWVRRQIILEDDILPILVEEAARRVMKDDIASDVDDLMEEIDRLDKRMMKLDEKFWAKIERSADPFPVTRNYDTEKDIPITEQFRLETKMYRGDIKRYIIWLKDPDPGKAPLTGYIASQNIDDPDMSYKMTKDDVVREAKDAIQKMTDLAYKFEEAYEKIMKLEDGTNGYVAQGDGSPVFSIDPFHVHILDPAKGRASDQKAADEWDKGYRREFKAVEQEVGDTLNKRGWGNQTGLEQFFGDLTGQGFEFYAAKTHPYWRRLLRLRFQIHKLQTVLKGNLSAAEDPDNNHKVTKAEVLRTFSDRMLLEGEALNPAKLPDDLKPVATDPGGTVANAPSVSMIEYDLGVAGERAESIRHAIELMEKEYRRLMNQILNMFDMELEIEPVAPAATLQVLSVLKATTLFGVKRDKDGQLVKSKSVGQIDVKDIAKVVQKYHWEIWKKGGNKTQEKDTQTPEVEFPLLEHGTYLMRIYAQGEHGVPLSEAFKAFQVETARFRGKLKIWGDWPAHAPIQLLADGFFVETVEPKAGTDVEYTLDEEFKRIQRLRTMNFDNLKSEFYVPFNASAIVDISPKAFSKKVEGEVFPGELWIDPSTPIELFYKYEVLIGVTVKDASDREVKDHIVVSSGKTSVDSAPFQFTLQLLRDDEVTVKAERLKTVSVSETDGPQKFDPDRGKTLDFAVKLPFFERGNLQVKGIFVFPDGLDPPAVMDSGTVRPNFGDESPVGLGGDFMFVNNKDILLSDSLELQGIVYSNDGRMFIPAGGVFTSKLKEGAELDLKDVKLEQHKVEVDPIYIKVKDSAGADVPKDKLTVLIGHQATVEDNDLFKGSWTFERRNEKVDVTVKLDMADGKPVEGSHTLSINDFDIMKKGKQTLPQPIEIRLPVFLLLEVAGETRVDVPQGKPAPLKVKLTNPPYRIDAFANADEAFQVSIIDPIRIGETVTIDAHAKKGGLDYKGSGSRTVPAKPGILNLGVITLTSDKKQTDFVTITNMTVASSSGQGQPVAGKSMVAIANVVVGKEYKGPLSMEWKRLSDGAEEIEVRNSVSPEQSVDTSADFPALPKSKQVTDDTLVLKVSDGADQEVSKSLNFSWKDTDEFKHMILRHTGKKKKIGSRFEIGETIGIASKWEIQDDTEPVRFIRYSVDGVSFFETDVTVPVGKTYSHDTSLDTKNLSTGRRDLTAELINNDQATSVSGSKKFSLVEGKDEILRAWASVALGNQAEGRNFQKGGQVFVNAWVVASESYDGGRTLTLHYQGKPVMTTSFTMQGGESYEQGFALNTGKLDSGRYRFKLVLSNDDQGMQDSKIIRLELKDDPQPDPPRNTGGMQDVYCWGDFVAIKVWDHASQDGDIVSLKLGNEIVLSGFNMDACGGPSEPAGPPCVFANKPLPAGSRIPISVFAHNEGDSSPNTAALKVEGGCTPELQHWGLSEGQGASIWLMRAQGAPPPQAAAQGQTQP